MSRLLFVSLLLLFAVPSAAQTVTPPVFTVEWHERIVHTAIGAGMLAHFADLSTTEYGLGAGKLEEGNPLMKPFTDRGPVPAAIAKGTLAVGSSYAFIRLHKSHPKWALALAIGQTVSVSVVAYRNTRLLR